MGFLLLGVYIIVRLKLVDPITNRCAQQATTKVIQHVLPADHTISHPQNTGVLSGLLLSDSFNNQFQLTDTVNGEQIQKAAKVANVVCHFPYDTVGTNLLTCYFGS